MKQKYFYNIIDLYKNEGYDNVEIQLDRKGLFFVQRKIASWQETYIEKLNKEYIELLNSEGKPSENFWALEEFCDELKEPIRFNTIIKTIVLLKVYNN